MEIGDSVVMLGEENAERGCVGALGLKGHSAGLYLYVPDVDAAFTQAKGAGAKVTMPVTDMFWGDRWRRSRTRQGTGGASPPARRTSRPRRSRSGQRPGSRRRGNRGHDG